METEQEEFMNQEEIESVDEGVTREMVQRIVKAKANFAMQESNIEHLFGERVKRLRISCEMSQEELAFRSGLHRNYISDVERGQRNVSLKALEKFAKGLGVGIRDFF